MASRGIDDQIASAVLSESEYERARVERFSHFKQPLHKKLAWLGGLMAALALVLPIYGAYPAASEAYLPSTAPGAASPKAVLLGVAGGGVVVLSAVLLLGAAGYRIGKAPVNRSQAHTILNVEDFAAYLGFGTGGLAILLTLGYFLLGAAGDGAIEGYMALMRTTNPFAASGLGVTVTHLGIGAFLASVGLLAAQAYVRFRLRDLPT